VEAYLEEELLLAGVEGLQQLLHSGHLHQAQAVCNTGSFSISKST